MSQVTRQKLTSVVLANIADRRVRGASWETVGAEFGWNPDDIRNVTWGMPEFESYLESAQQSLLQEYQAKMLKTLGQQLDSTDQAVALKAALALAKFIASQQRDNTRTKVESLRVQAALARTRLRDAKPETKVDRDWEDDTDEAQAQVQSQRDKKPQAAPPTPTPTANVAPVTVSPAATGSKRVPAVAGIDLSLAPLG
jgi:hypothetical protein